MCAKKLHFFGIRNYSNLEPVKEQMLMDKSSFKDLSDTLSVLILASTTSPRWGSLLKVAYEFVSEAFIYGGGGRDGVEYGWSSR